MKSSQQSSTARVLDKWRAAIEEPIDRKVIKTHFEDFLQCYFTERLAARPVVHGFPTLESSDDGVITMTVVFQFTEYGESVDED